MTDRDILEELVENGGRVSPDAVVEPTEYDLSTVRKAIERMDHLVDSQTGDTALDSGSVEEEVRRVIATTEGLDDEIELGSFAIADGASETDLTLLEELVHQ